MNLRRGFGRLLLWIVVSVLTLDSGMRWLDDDLRRTPIRIEWEGAELRLWNNGIHDKVVTHLVSPLAEATLSPPLLLRNHQGEKRVVISSLAWRDTEGKHVPAPSPRDAIGAVVVDAGVQMR